VLLFVLIFCDECIECTLKSHFNRVRLGYYSDIVRKQIMLLRSNNLSFSVGAAARLSNSHSESVVRLISALDQD